MSPSTISRGLGEGVANSQAGYTNLLLLPANEVCEGNVFTGVCLSKGGFLSRGDLCPGGLCPGGVCPGGLCPGGLCPGGVSTQGGSLSRKSLSGGLYLGGGLCAVGSLSGRPPVW